MSIAFSAPDDMLYDFFFKPFNVADYIDFQMLNQPCICGIHPIWLWCIILLTYFLDSICKYFTQVFFFASMFMESIRSYSFPFFKYHYLFEALV